jgi:hypothetical protein
MNATEQIIEWLSTRDLISFNKLEKKCGMPQGCLYKAKNNVVSLPERHIPALAKELKPYGFRLK